MSDLPVSSKNDPRPHFDLHVTMPVNPELAEMVRDVAVHGARHAGCTDADAAAFGRKVEDAVRETLTAARTNASISIEVRWEQGPVEVIIGSGRDAHTLTIEV
jgi:hypothetical protein